MPKDGGVGEWANSFASLDEALEGATKHGFDPVNQKWIASVNGRTTHYRPGKTPTNMPAGQEPAD